MVYNQKASAAILWTDAVNSQPIEDLKSAQKLCADVMRYYGTDFEMSSKTFDQLGMCKQIIDYLNLPYTRMNVSEFLDLFGSNDGLTSLHISDLVGDGKVVIRCKTHGNEPHSILYIGY